MELAGRDQLVVPAGRVGLGVEARISAGVVWSIDNVADIRLRPSRPYRSIAVLRDIGVVLVRVGVRGHPPGPTS